MLLPFLLLALGLLIFAATHLLSWKPKPHPVVIVSVMLESGDKLLLGKRLGKSDSTGGLLSTPGGKVDYHETLKAAAARELFEETGMRVPANVFDVLGFKEHPNRYRGHYITFYLTARYKTQYGMPINREPQKCEGWQWLALDEFEHNECTEPNSVLAAWTAHWRVRAQ